MPQLINKIIELEEEIKEQIELRREQSVRLRRKLKWSAVGLVGVGLISSFLVYLSTKDGIREGAVKPAKVEKAREPIYTPKVAEVKETKNKAENEHKEKIEYYKSLAQSYEGKLVGYYSTSVSLEEYVEHIAVLYTRAEECDKAASYFKRVPEPKASSHNLLGLCYQKKGELEAAISEFEKAVMKDFSNKAYHWNLGNAYEKAGRLEEAQREFKVPWGNMMPREANKYVKELEKSMKVTNSN